MPLITLLKGWPDQSPWDVAQMVMGSRNLLRYRKVYSNCVNSGNRSNAQETALNRTLFMLLRVTPPQYPSHKHTHTHTPNMVIYTPSTHIHSLTHILKLTYIQSPHSHIHSGTLTTLTHAHTHHSHTLTHIHTHSTCAHIQTHILYTHTDTKQVGQVIDTGSWLPPFVIFGINDLDCHPFLECFLEFSDLQIR